MWQYTQRRYSVREESGREFNFVVVDWDRIQLSGSQLGGDTVVRQWTGRDKVVWQWTGRGYSCVEVDWEGYS